MFGGPAVLESVVMGLPPADKRSAFETVAVPHMTVVYNRSLNLARRQDVAADLTQETFLRAYRTFDNFAPGTNAKAWLLTILYSVFVSRYRQEQRQPNVVALEEADHHASPAGEQAVTMDSRMWASDEVHAALEKLPETFRTVLLMVDVDELTYEEAAAALRCPTGTVRSRLCRARKMMHAELQEYARGRGFTGNES